MNTKRQRKLLPEVLSLLGNSRFNTDVECCSLLGSLTYSTIYAAIVLLNSCNCILFFTINNFV